MAWYFKFVIKLLLIVVLVISVQYLHSIAINQHKESSIGNTLIDEIPQPVNLQGGDNFWRNNSRKSNLQLTSKVLASSSDYYEFKQENPVVNPSCPKKFEITDSNNEWFTKTFEQISPFKEYVEESNYTQHDLETIYQNEVVVMTPISNVRNKLLHYFKLICSLTYPHEKISIVLGEDSSHDQTLYEARKLADLLRPYFKRIEVFHLLGNQPKSDGNMRHDRNYQFFRRKHLAMSRNQIVSRGLKDESWVLWLDADVRHIPVDLIQHLLSSRKDIVTVNCLYRMGDGKVDTFDRNTWQETSDSLQALRDKPADYLMLEGYGGSKRKFLNDLKSKPTGDIISPNETNVIKPVNDSDIALTKIDFDKTSSDGEPVKLDGVGGCVLLVKAELHIKGLNFPPYTFNHHIETEGFAKIASEVYGVHPHGLPRVHVIHW